MCHFKPDLIFNKKSRDACKINTVWPISSWKFEGLTVVHAVFLLFLHVLFISLVVSNGLCLYIYPGVPYVVEGL